MCEDKKSLPTHHIQQIFCTSRPLYRQGRNLTSIKVFTVNNESQHLIIYKVPVLKLSNELKRLCVQFGELKKFGAINKYRTEEFTECFHVQYQRIQSARIAKRFLDNKSFYGEILHACYAPEFETFAETRAKLKQRKKDVLSRLQSGPTQLEYVNYQPNTQMNRKRKHPGLLITEDRLRNADETEIWKGIPQELDPMIQTNDPNIKKHYSSVAALQKKNEPEPQIPVNHVAKDIKVHNNVVIKSSCKKRIVFRK